MWHSWGHMARLWGSGEKKSKPGILLLLGSRVGPEGFSSSLFTGEFKTYEQKFKVLGNEKTTAPGVSY